MVEPYVTSSIVYASLFGLMALGLTLTYLTTKVPNFAYGSFVTIGIYTSFTLYKLQGLNPYFSAPIAFAVGGLSSVAMYLGVLRTLARRGASLVSLMIATLALDIGFIGVFGIYTDFLYYNLGIYDSKTFYQLLVDFSLFGLPGLIYVAPISLAAITIGLFLLLTRTKFGIAMRASVENPSLARILGIDVEKVYVFAWFLAGGFAALSGSYYDLFFTGTTSSGSDLIVEIFASSILGGLASIYGAAIGGLIIGASEILITLVGVNFLGSWIARYQRGIPLIIMIITLLVLPQGLASIDWKRVLRLEMIEKFMRSRALRYIVRLRLLLKSFRLERTQ